MCYNRSMFKKLFRNIYLPVFLIALTLIVFVDVFSIVMIEKTLGNAFGSVGRKRVSRALDSCELYINSVSVSTYNLSVNDTLISELSAPSDRSLTSLLDNTCNYSLKMNGVCAYSAGGKIYTSSGVSMVPSLAELRQNGPIADLIEGNGESLTSFRTEYVADIYSNVAYPDDMGVVTCCRKVYGEGGEVVGYIFADVLPSNLYDLLFEREAPDDAVAFITFGGKYFDYGGNTAHGKLLTGGHRGYFKYEASADDGLFSLVIFESTKPYHRQLAILIGSLLAVSAVLVVAVHFAAMGTAKNVTKRLDRLTAKMNAQELPAPTPSDMVTPPPAAEDQKERSQ